MACNVVCMEASKIRGFNRLYYRLLNSRALLIRTLQKPPPERVEADILGAALESKALVGM